MDAKQRTIDTSLAVAGQLLDALSADLLRRSGSEAVSNKRDGTPITAVDIEVDERLRDTILQELPGHGVISEEGDTVTPATDWTWIIDPIDGTSNYTTGVPYWCVSMALACEGVPVLGLIDAPALQRRYTAVSGQGATRNGAPIRVRAPVDFRDRANRHIALMVTTAAARRARAAGIRLNVRVMGSTALDLALVADGGAVASLALIPHVWDVAAGHVLVTEAGGAVVSPQGDRLLPLQVGVDHRTTSAITAAAATPDYASEIAELLMQ